MNIKDINLAHLYRAHLIDFGGSDSLRILEQVNSGKVVTF